MWYQLINLRRSNIIIVVGQYRSYIDELIVQMNNMLMCESYSSYKQKKRMPAITVNTSSDATKTLLMFNSAIMTEVVYQEFKINVKKKKKSSQDFAFFFFNMFFNLHSSCSGWVVCNITISCFLKPKGNEFTLTITT